MRRTRVFIGSATESLHVAEALQSVLASDDLEVVPWPDVFNLSEYPLDDLADATEDHDFAVFVFSPDDMVTSRDAEALAPRDNVVYELGLFVGKLGRRRTFVVQAKGALKVPSDLAGLTYASYTAPNAPHDDRRWESALRDPARRVRGAISRVRQHEAARQAAQEAAVPVGEPQGAALSAAVVPVAPSALAEAQLLVEAQAGRLSVLTTLRVGAVAVHPLHGFGQVVGYDPPSAPDRAARVRFATGVGAVPVEELYSLAGGVDPATTAP